MNATCYIIDDQPHIIKSLSRLIGKASGLELVAADTDPLVALNKILTGVVSAHILFMDIDMPGMSGLELSRIIGSRAIIIFVTGHTGYALDAFDIGAADYLVKPVEETPFLRAVERARERLQAVGNSAPAEPESIYVRLDSRNIQRITLANLIWVEALDKYVHLHLADGKRMLITRSLNNVEAALPQSLFIRIHKSHIINLKQIKSITGNTLTLATGVTLNIGPNYKDRLMGRLNVL